MPATLQKSIDYNTATSVGTRNENDSQAQDRDWNSKCLSEGEGSFQILSKEINMASKNTAVYGIYHNRAQAEHTVLSLLTAGFSNDDVSVLLPDSESTKDFAHEKNTKAPEGTTAGVTSGGAIGGTIGLLAGIGALAIPGVGPLIAAGPIMGALAGLGVGGAIGGLIGALVGMGIPEYEAKRYEGHIKEGGVLLSVHCDTADDIQSAKDLLKQTGAQDIASSGEASSDYPAVNKIALTR